MYVWKRAWNMIYSVANAKYEELNIIKINTHLQLSDPESSRLIHALQIFKA